MSTIAELLAIIEWPSVNIKEEGSAPALNSSAIWERMKPVRERNSLIYDVVYFQTQSNHEEEEEEEQ